MQTPVSRPGRIGQQIPERWVRKKTSSAALNIDNVHISFNLAQTIGAEHEDKSNL
jgi:hypothetical protein